MQLQKHLSKTSVASGCKSTRLERERERENVTFKKLTYKDKGGFEESIMNCTCGRKEPSNLHISRTTVGNIQKKRNIIFKSSLISQGKKSWVLDSSNVLQENM